MSQLFTLEYFPASGGSPVTQTFGDWGISEQWEGAFRSLVSDVLTLKIDKARAGILDTFEPRSRIVIRDDNGNLFFQGVFPGDDRVCEHENSIVSFEIAGPWWYLAGLPFVRVIHTDYWTGGKAGIGTHNVFDADFTAFNLNMALDSTYMATRAMLTEILNFAIGRGAYFQFDAASLPDVTILPTPYKNAMCADVVRQQLQDIDAVAWFDHTIDPPVFHIKQRGDCPPTSRTLGPSPTGGDPEVIAVKLKRLDALAVPYAQISFMSGVTVNGTTFASPVVFTYPSPRPTGTLNNFYPFVASVTLNPTVVKSVSARIYTREVTQDLTWLKAVRPEYDPAQNPNAANDYSGLAIVAGSFTRQTALPRMLLQEKGNYASWMGGNVVKETITLKVSYTRLIKGTLIGTKVPDQTITIQINATDIAADGAGGILLENNVVTLFGEDPSSYATLPQTIFNSLNLPCYDGPVECFEDATTGWVGLGTVLNLQGDVTICRPEWNVMNALVQEVSFKTFGDSHFIVTANVGVNKKLTPGQLRDRMLAKRLLQPIEPFFYSGTSDGLTIQNGNGGGPEVPDQHGIDSQSGSYPGIEEHYVSSPPAADGSMLVARMSSDGQGGQPVIEIKKVDKNGAVLTTVPQISIASADIVGAPAGTKAQMRDWGNGVSVLSTGVAATGGLRWMKITAVNGEFVSAVDWDGTIAGTLPFNVAKPEKFRTTWVNQVFDGATVNYNYSDSNNRVADDGTNSEHEVCDPRYAVNELIYAINVTPHTGVVQTPAVGSTPAVYVTLLETNSARVWARRNIQ